MLQNKKIQTAISRITIISPIRPSSDLRAAVFFAVLGLLDEEAVLPERFPCDDLLPDERCEGTERVPDVLFFAVVPDFEPEAFFDVDVFFFAVEVFFFVDADFPDAAKIVPPWDFPVLFFEVLYGYTRTSPIIFSLYYTFIELSKNTGKNMFDTVRKCKFLDGFA